MDSLTKIATRWNLKKLLTMSLVKMPAMRRSRWRDYAVVVANMISNQRMSCLRIEIRCILVENSRVNNWNTECSVIFATKSSVIPVCLSGIDKEYALIFVAKRAAKRTSAGYG
uniref:(northern house mosquito) hypothetical protein n=1 Tax=Culex pipiens TaxID=7175 RepID=A0A8D8FIR5_CULPI